MKTFSLKLFTIAIAMICFNLAYTQVNKINFKEFKLKNGLTVVLNEDNSRPEVFGIVVVNVGSKNDPANATGLAHYQEHMLFKGTQKIGTTNWEKEKVHIDNIFKLYDELGQTLDEVEREKIQLKINEETIKAGEYAIPNEFDKILKSIGGVDMNANTSFDRTVYFNAFPPNQIEKWLDLYSHRFMEPVFRLFQSELEVVYEEKNLYNDNFFTAILENFLKNFYKVHPYGQQTTIGTVDHLKNPSLSKMYEFFKTYYVANNMALIISGDFKSDEIIPMIEEKFGKLPKGEIPQFTDFKEEPFKGREEIVMKLSPVKIGILGFRTPNISSQDYIAFEVFNKILSNRNQTGLFNKLALDNKLLAAEIFSMPLNDYGMTAILMVPKILGQKLENAEELVLSELKKVKEGNFSDTLIESIKLQMLKDYYTSLESNESRGILLAETFGYNQKLDKVNEYPEKVKSITKDEIIKIANAYFGDNYLAFYSKMGFPKKNKLEKPKYQPVAPKKDAVSEYYTEFEKIQPKEISPKFVDFEQDLSYIKIKENVNVHYVNNPKNDIFSMKIKFGYGNFINPRLNYASQLLNYAGTKSYNVNQFKEQIASLGCNISFYSNDSYFVIDVEGYDENIKACLNLTKELLINPIIEKDKLNIILEGEKTNRKFEQSEPDGVATALFEYVKYGKNSDYLNRLSLKEIKKLSIDTLISDFKKAISYDVNVHYTGNVSKEDITSLIYNFTDFNEKFKKGNSPISIDAIEYNVNTIYFVNFSNALQSKIYLMANGSEFNIDKKPVINAFNQYFSGDFSGLVLQEIREYRSLAYGAGARYRTPILSGKKSLMYGYVATQDDKTIEAIDVFTGLFKNMPEKPERIANIKSYLSQELIQAYPYFRNLSETVESWKHMGYKEDPAIKSYKYYKDMSFKNIMEFYKNDIQPKPIVYSIVGDKKRVNIKELEKYGKIIFIEQKDLFK